MCTKSAQKIGLVHGPKVIVRKKQLLSHMIQLYQYNTSRT